MLATCSLRARVLSEVECVRRTLAFLVFALPICSRRFYGESGSSAVAEGRDSWASQR